MFDNRTKIISKRKRGHVSYLSKEKKNSDKGESMPLGGCNEIIKRRHLGETRKKKSHETYTCRPRIQSTGPAWSWKGTFSEKRLDH